MPMQRSRQSNPPCVIGLQQHFDVRFGVELVAFGAQFVAQFKIIVDFAVEGDPQRFARDGHRLVTAGRHVDDGEAAVCRSIRSGENGAGSVTCG